MEEEYHNNSEPGDGDNLLELLLDLSTRWGKLVPTLPYGAFKDDTDSDLFLDVWSDFQHAQHWLESGGNSWEALNDTIRQAGIILINHAIDCLEYSTSGVTASLDNMIGLLSNDEWYKVDNNLRMQLMSFYSKV